MFDQLRKSEQLKRARDLAIQQKPLLRAYLSEEVRDQVVAGDVLVAQMWAQVSQVAMDNSSNLAFSFPTEGFALYADNCCHFEGKQAQGSSVRVFELSCCGPNVAAAIATEMRTATANAGRARNCCPKRSGITQCLYPAAETLERGEWFRALPGQCSGFAIVTGLKSNQRRHSEQPPAARFRQTLFEPLLAVRQTVRIFAASA